MLTMSVCFLNSWVRLTGCRNFFKETIKLVIGKEKDKIEINVPKTPLCDVSGYFKAACSVRWLSGREGVINLEDEDPKIFNIFLAWLFNGSLESSEDYIDVTLSLQLPTLWSHGADNMSSSLTVLSSAKNYYHSNSKMP